MSEKTVSDVIIAAKDLIKALDDLIKTWNGPKRI